MDDETLEEILYPLILEYRSFEGEPGKDDFLERVVDIIQNSSVE